MHSWFQPILLCGMSVSNICSLHYSLRNWRSILYFIYTVYSVHCTDINPLISVFIRRVSVFVLASYAIVFGLMHLCKSCSTSFFSMNQSEFRFCSVWKTMQCMCVVYFCSGFFLICRPYRIQNTCHIHDSNKLLSIFIFRLLSRILLRISLFILSCELYCSAMNYCYNSMILIRLFLICCSIKGKYSRSLPVTRNYFVIKTDLGYTCIFEFYAGSRNADTVQFMFLNEILRSLCLD